jgi:dephospho-CoA kinase
MIVGITGTNGSGKGTVVDILLEKGFHHYSARAFITEEIVKRKLPVNRESMVSVANDLRLKYGPSYVAEALFQKAKLEGGNAVIESLRTVGEIEALRNKFGANKKKGRKEFILIAVDADIGTRYDRINSRKSETDSVSLEQFQVQESNEMMNTDQTKQNISACIELADFLIINDGTVDDLRRKVEDVLK